MKFNQRTIILSTLSLATAAILTTACSSKSTESVMYAETAAAIAEAQYNATTEAAADYYENGEYDVYNEYDSIKEAPADGYSLGTAESVPTPATTNRKLIRTVSLQVESTEFNTMLKDITNSVTASGGYMQNSEVYGNEANRSSSTYGTAYLTIRVPSDKLDSFITKLEEQGNITYKSESTEDVTLQYSDIESRKKALSIEQERLWELLAKAESIETIIALEARLSDIRYQLESFESQLRLYDNQVDYSTINLTLSEVKVLSPTTPDTFGTRIQKGLSRNLSNLGNEIIDTIIWLITNLPYLLVNGVILIIVIIIIRFIIRIIIKRHPSLKKKDIEDNGIKK